MWEEFLGMIASLAALFRSAPRYGRPGIGAEARIGRLVLVAASRG
jgi:hypothetical protein